MTDFEKIMAVTRRAKVSAERANEALPLLKGSLKSIGLALAGPIVNIYFDQEYIKLQFDDPYQRAIAMSWYNTVFELKCNGAK